MAERTKHIAARVDEGLDDRDLGLFLVMISPTERYMCGSAMPC